MSHPMMIGEEINLLQDIESSHGPALSRPEVLVDWLVADR